MTTTISSFIAGLPKAELHMHLEGSLEPETLMTLARRNGVKLRYDSADALRAAYRFNNLQEFLDLYYLGLSVLLTADDFYEMTLAYLERAARDNVRHAEVFISPQAHTRRDLPAAMFIESILAAFETAKEKYGIGGGLIVGIQRQFPEEEALAMMQDAKPYRDQILGLGMGGPEIGNPPSKFKRAFALARDEFGWRTMVHAGEEGSADYVREAVEILNVDRIDHGVRCEEDPALVRELAARGTPLTVCPLSNVALRVFPDIQSHNLRRLFDAGLHVTINSDDPPYFGGYINENYAACQTAMQLSDDQLAALAHNSFTAAILADDVRMNYLDELAAYRDTRS
jgi:adenine deaminase